MSWRKNLADWLSDALRLIARAGLLLDGIIFSIFSVWFTYKVCRKLMDLFNAWLFTD